jgi:hypothetical protein
MFSIATGCDLYTSCVDAPTRPGPPARVASVAPTIQICHKIQIAISLPSLSFRFGKLEYRYVYGSGVHGVRRAATDHRR